MRHRPDKALEVVGGPIGINKGDDLMYATLAENLGDRFQLGFSKISLNYNQVRNSRYGNIRRLPSGGQVVLALRQRSTRTLASYGRDIFEMAASVTGVRLLRLIREEEVAAILDCSGFAYGDQWSTRRTLRRAAHYRRAKERGVRLVMMPQALGPFEKPDVAAATRRMLEPFDVIYARDERSLEYVAGLRIPGPALRIAPDITHLVSPEPPDRGEYWGNRVCMVPNARMVDKVDGDDSARYVEVMAAVVRSLSEAEVACSMVIHETQDLAIADGIIRACGVDIEVVEGEARELKGIIGAALGVIGSRFHAILSALSQGVPVVGTSWSHKYEALFAEYDYRANLVSDLGDGSELLARVKRLLDPTENEAQRRHLARHAATQKAQVRTLFDDVTQVALTA